MTHSPLHAGDHLCGGCVGGPPLIILTTHMHLRLVLQVLVKTVSSSVNPVDVLVRNGFYNPQIFPKVLGCDLAGTVHEADEHFKVCVCVLLDVCARNYMCVTGMGWYK